MPTSLNTPIKMRIIAFDIGKWMAWANNTGPKLAWGSQLYEGDRPARFAAIQSDIQILLRHGKLHNHTTFCVPKAFDALVYETPFARGLHATRSGWGIAGILEACAIQANMPVVDVSVATIKKFATGDGKAPKNVMIKAARGFGYKGSNEHEADAVCLLKYAEENLEYNR